MYQLLLSSTWSYEVIIFSTFVEYLKPIAAQEREVEAARAKERAELEAIRKAEAAKGVNDQRFLLKCNKKLLIHC